MSSGLQSTLNCISNRSWFFTWSKCTQAVLERPLSKSLFNWSLIGPMCSHQSSGSSWPLFAFWWAANDISSTNAVGTGHPTILNKPLLLFRSIMGGLGTSSGQSLAGDLALLTIVKIELWAHTLALGCWPWPIWRVRCCFMAEGDHAHHTAFKPQLIPVHFCQFWCNRCPGSLPIGRHRQRLFDSSWLPKWGPWRSTRPLLC